MNRENKSFFFFNLFLGKLTSALNFHYNFFIGDIFEGKEFQLIIQNITPTFKGLFCEIDGHYTTVTKYLSIRYLVKSFLRL
jgi:hypothetical protein